MGKQKRIDGLKDRTLDSEGGALPFAGTDQALIAAAIRAVGEELDRAKVEPGAKKFAELVAVTYEHSVGIGHVDPAYVRSLVKLVI